jgi:hypothetical protein
MMKLFRSCGRIRDPDSPCTNFHASSAFFTDDYSLLNARPNQRAIHTHSHGIHGSYIYTLEYLMYSRRGNDILCIYVFVGSMTRVRVGVKVAPATVNY